MESIPFHLNLPWVVVNIFSQIIKSITGREIFCQNNCIGRVIGSLVITLINVSLYCIYPVLSYYLQRDVWLLSDIVLCDGD